LTNTNNPTEKADNYRGDSMNPTHTLDYSTDMVCEDCGSSKWHVNLFYSNRNGQWFYGDDEYGENATWCGNCGGECSLIDPNDYKYPEMTYELISVGCGVDDNGMLYPMLGRDDKTNLMTYDMENGSHINDIQPDDDWMLALSEEDRTIVNQIKKKIV
jgi:hypothetical protein